MLTRLITYSAIFAYFLLAGSGPALCSAQGSEQAQESQSVTGPDGSSYRLFPVTYADRPELPSPHTDASGQDYIVVRMIDGRYAVLLVTMRRADERPQINLPYPANQLVIDAEDFPTLAATGQHSEQELDAAASINGKPLAQINASAKPGAISEAGFIAEDEDIISVLRGDNRLVGAMGLTHAQLGRVLFHVWNTFGKGTLSRFNAFDLVYYNGCEVAFRSEGSRGWQDSIFDDGVIGSFQLWFSRPLSADEERFLRDRYSRLAPEQFDAMVEALTSIHTGEMVAYYAYRYGFYEGHTGYRADPIALAFIFGLRSLEQIEAAFDGRLYEALTEHHTNSFSRQ